MAASARLLDHLPQPGEQLTPDALLDRFLTSITARGLSLYPAQEEAILELFGGKHVVLNTPTGSGKSLVAEALHFKALAERRTSFYTCPIKALVNEKFFALCDTFGPKNVGMMTGDASVNRDAPIICCTAEVLANLCLGEGAGTVDYVVMDEFHYYADKERGVAWQLPLLSLTHTTFLLMSATLGPTDAIEESLKALTHRDVAAVRSGERPVPLEYEYVDTPLHETIAKLVEKNRAPIYLVNFTQRAAAEQAQALTSVVLLTRDEREQVRQLLFDVKFDTPYGKDVERYLKAGIGLHHAGLLPKYRRQTERLAQKGLLKVVSGTDTLGMGVNIPIRTVLFTQLCKFDGQKTGILSARDFKQISGRAGRKGFDVKGYVVAQAPEHVVENKRLEAKAAAGKKVQKKQPPEKGYVHFDKSTFERLQSAEPEALTPRFDVSFPILITLLQNDELWPQGGYGRFVELMKRSHGTPVAKQRLKKKAATMFRALRRAGIVEVARYPEGHGSFVRMSATLQDDFSLFTTLSLYLVEVLGTLDPTQEFYALDVVTLCEAIAEDPMAVLFKLRDKAKEEAINKMKAEGVPYEERIEKLQQVDYPKPNAEFIYGTFTAFAEHHPWVGTEDIRPKSIARDMLERYLDFAEYVKEYGLQRSEGVLLRYLAEIYKALAQTVPESMRTEALDDIVVFLRELIRGTDSSLLDEWEHLMDPTAPRKESVAAPVREATEAEKLAANPRQLAARVRTDLHRLLKLLAAKDFAGALAAMAKGEEEWTVESLGAAMNAYFAEHPKVDLTPKARLPHNTVLREDGTKRWLAMQKIVDETGEADWMLEGVVDLNRELEPGAPLVALRRIGT